MTWENRPRDPPILFRAESSTPFLEVHDVRLFYNFCILPCRSFPSAFNAISRLDRALPASPQLGWRQGHPPCSIGHHHSSYRLEEMFFNYPHTMLERRQLTSVHPCHSGVINHPSSCTAKRRADNWVPEILRCCLHQRSTGRAANAH